MLLIIFFRLLIIFTKIDIVFLTPKMGVKKGEGDGRVKHYFMRPLLFIKSSQVS